ncbi:bone morphogenetic protein receptor type-2 isoform X2 [Tribolium madens]|uniref:bone morphogenetic protein receptor type-2 isoform X2 n=1 Tax=Tribolium madens TaxID=41895 RepID=UPI001CF74666|nr:bone morphogenetic protein receptor type-2 isoform X2 [Tribolium madens]
MNLTEKFIVFFFSLQCVSAIKDNSKDFIFCAKAAGTITHIKEDGGPEEISTESPDEKCVKNYCYTLWKEDPNDGTKTIMGQGCWDTSGKPNECDRAQCLAANRPPKAMNNTKFCCCSEDMCNVNFTDAYVPVEDFPPSTTEVAPKKSVKSFIWIVVVVSFIFVTVIALGASYYLWKKKPKKNDVEGGHQHTVPPPADYSLDKLKLLNVIGQGRYGCVWRGMIDDQEVAVKVFAAHHRNYFLNEHEIYKLSGENSALLKCYGGGEYVTAPGGLTDYRLLLSLEQECLQEYLKNHTLDLMTLSKMSLGVARGLAHLHSDLGKPCIAHRDINSRNILVRPDLTCCICDLGLAVIPRLAENKSISEAGTLRYMAPEVLEGAVNLRDCESALKQIDVYALGLVLWELGIRCSDMQNSEPPSYTPPFFKEAGENPTLEQMQTLVSRHKARPLWPPSWKDTAAARLLCETAEDCWDQDAEARLTSLCVVERLLELPSLKGRVLHSMHPPASPTPLINNNHLHDHQIDISVGTVETLLSPSEEHCKNSNQLVACVTPLQPYQGRNPCLERNLLSGSSDSLLIDKSSKHCTSSEFQNLITNDFLNYQINYRATPIPYLQNAVHGSPKQSNTSSEGSKSRFKWNGFMKLFPNKKYNSSDNSSKATQVKLNAKLVNGQNGVTTSLLSDSETKRPSTLPLNVVKSQENSCGVTQILKRKNSLSRQRLKDPSQRIKTPGDVPPSVRRTRGKAAKESARFSLYDDRMMSRGQWGSAPDLEPPVPPKLPQLNDLQDRDSVSSF